MSRSVDRVEYPGTKLDVRWSRALCLHVGECVRAEGEVFAAGRDPWCEPDGAAAQEVLEIVRRCPTGALSAAPKPGEPDERPDAENTVVVSNNGPLYLRGDLEIEAAAPEWEGVRFRAALCRCGKSENKAFCDNAHEKAGFVDRGAVGEKGDEALAPTGRLRVKRIKDGPLLVTGGFALVAASGRVAWRGKRAALCRCGHSKNKPFCDGAHSAAAFRAD